MAGGSPETGGRGGEKRGGQELWRCRASHPCPQHSTGRGKTEDRMGQTLPSKCPGLQSPAVLEG